MLKKTAPSTKSEAPLHLKYRPKTFGDVIGQAEVCKALAALIAGDRARAFLFTGPSGCGKTTLARIVASKLGVPKENILEVDAATHTSVEAMRTIQDAVRHQPFGQDFKRAIIIDECHRLSRQAWESMLKIVEEPPKGVYWCFCTTEAGKIAATLKTRCAAFTLKPVDPDKLRALCRSVCQMEDIDLHQDVERLVVAEANGSPRQMLVNLALCRDAQTKAEAARVLDSAMYSEGLPQLAQLLLRGGSWAKAAKIAQAIPEDAEGIRIALCHYMAKVAADASDPIPALNIISHFGQAYNQSDGKAPLFVSIGRVLFGE